MPSSQASSRRSRKPKAPPAWRKPLLITLGVAAVAGAIAAGVVMLPRLLATEASELAKARTLIEKKDGEAARITLKALLQQHPQSAEGRLLLGQLLLEAGDPAGAEAELRRALEAGQPDASVLPLLAASMVAQGKGKLLVLQFGKTELAEAEAEAKFRTHIAEAEAADGDLNAAEEALAQAQRRVPGFGPARLLAARLAAGRGDLAGALQQAEALIAAQADNAGAWSLKGDLLLAQAGGDGDATPAIAAYRRSLELQPRNVAAHSAVVGALIARRDFAAATTQWQAMNKVAANHPQTLFFEALLADQRGDLKRTREITQLLLRGAPENPRVLLLAGSTELKLGASAQAEALLGKAVANAPKAAAARRLLASAQLRNGQADKALATLQPLLDGQAADAEALALAAQAQLTKGDGAAAEASFQKAAKLKPEDARLKTAVAVSQIARGQDASGFAALENLAAQDKGSSADLALISGKLRRGDVAGALKAIDALAAKQPKDPLADQLRGRVALQQKDGAGARKHFEAALAKNAQFMPALSGLAMLDLADSKPEQARARFEAVAKADAKHVGSRLALAEISARSGAPRSETQKWLDEAVKADPADATARVLLIDHLASGGDSKAALAAAQAALAALPDHPELTDRLGRLQLAGGDTQQAIATFGKLAKLLPASPLPQLRLADAHAAAKNPSGVTAAVQRAREIAPDALPVLQAQAMLALQDKRPADALAAARRVQTLLPEAATGWLIEGDVEMRQQHWDAAAAALRKALAKAQPGDAATRLHAALNAGKKTAEAEALAADWRKRHPQDLGFVMHLGDSAMAAGQLAKAEALYREVLALRAEHPLALNNLAYALAAQKKPGGVALAERALKAAPEAPAMLDTLALALAAENQLPKAVEVQAKAVKLAPEAAQYRLQLARLQIQAGDKAAARGELQTLAALGAKFPRQAEVAELLKSTAN
ncbi:MAG: PEP-CTERM system TPR-repeat protein PrsT [Burkholderiaceae bacterium]|nr:PEP-CTERM system TPR-repeat protein PrsT [Burkholderiaceae bacterium]